MTRRDLASCVLVLHVLRRDRMGYVFVCIELTNWMTTRYVFIPTRLRKCMYVCMQSPTYDDPTFASPGSSLVALLSHV